MKEKILYASIIRYYAQLTILLILFALSYTSAQISNKISKVTVEPVREEEPITFRVELINTSVIDKVEIAYRSFGQIDFKRKEMVLTNNLASVTIQPTSFSSTILEYYFLLYGDGENLIETYPLENPEENPLKLNLQLSNEKEEIIWILSPEPDEDIVSEDVFISFTLMDQDTLIKKDFTKVYLDNVNISELAIISDNLFVVKSNEWETNLRKGLHTVKVELYDIKQNLITSRSWNFKITQSRETEISETPARLNANGSIQLETRQENIEGRITPYNRATMKSSANYGQFKINGLLYFTNEEKWYRQPQNRYFIGAESPWLKIGYGDNYPIFTNLIINGKRLRGFTGNLMLGSFNVDIASGVIARKIESEIKEIIPFDSLSIVQQRDSTSVYVSYEGNWAKVKPGIYERKLFAIRPSFGKADESHIGISYLHSKDDVQSISYGLKPMENVVLGSDFKINIDSRRFEIFGEAAFSAINTDISSGDIPEDSINSIFKEPDYSESDREKIRWARKLLTRFITVNQYLVPLSIKNMTTLSYEGGLILNYFNNYLRLNYLRHGNNYESFGQTSLQRDIAGFRLSDRVNIFEKQVVLSGGIERLKDNTAKTKAATTTFTTTNFSISYFPIINFPSVTVGYLLAANSNGLSSDPTFGRTMGVDDKTSRVYIQLYYSFRYAGFQTLSLSYSNSSKDDRSPRNIDTRASTFNLSNTTVYNIPLQTTISLMINANRFSTYENRLSLTEKRVNYTTFYCSAEYRLFEENLRISTMLSPTFGDYQRTLLCFGMQYYFLKNVSALSTLNLYFNKNANNSTVWSLVLRADI